ncbi:MAG: TPM domain-containing protein, partial [Bryobacteraceae bacterium]
MKSLALAGFLPLLCAYDWKALKPQGYVSDFARVVDATSRAGIERYGADLERKTGVQIALVTVRSLEG